MSILVVPVAPRSHSMFPPLCLILRILCHSCMCSSPCRGQTQTDVTAALGTVQIMVGLFNVGLGPGRTSTRPGDVAGLRAAYWLGAVYTATGIMSLIAGRLSSHRLVAFAVLVNIVGCIFAVVGIVLYAIDLGDASVVWMCERTDSFGTNCISVAFFVQSLLTGMDITLIVLAVLQLCVCISLAVLSIRAVVNEKGEEGAGGADVYQPALKEDLTNSSLLPFNESKHNDA